MRWEEFLTGASDKVHQRAAEVIFRVSQGSVHGHGVFNGDPHPGNYRFHADGSVTFLDFGLVKRWTNTERDQLMPLLERLLQHDRQGTVDAMVHADFLAPDHDLDTDLVWEYVSGPYEPYLTDEFTFTREWTSSTLSRLLDMNA